MPLSEAVRLAQANGYSEPDPRMDLCGMDVVRKITILARESGYRVETSDIAIEPFLPAELFEGSTEAFMEALPQLDAAFERERQRLVPKAMLALRRRVERRQRQRRSARNSHRSPALPTRRLEQHYLPHYRPLRHPDDHPRLRSRCGRHRRRCLCRRDARGEYLNRKRSFCASGTNRNLAMRQV